MSRRRNRNELVTIYWRDIPAQVTAHVGAERSQALLPEHFQKAIDRAAAVAGLTSTDDYVNEWRKVAEPLGEDDPAVQAKHRAAELEAACPRSILEALVETGGIARGASDHSAPATTTPSALPNFSPEQDQQ